MRRPVVSMRTPETVDGHAVDAGWICARYESMRARLPDARFGATTIRAPHLQALADEFDVFVLDAFGVLNVGAEPIAGAPERIAQLQRLGKITLVLTNGATATAGDANEKYAGWGFQFAANEVISSRDVLSEALLARPNDWTWGVSAPAHAKLGELPVRCLALGDQRGGYDAVDGFVLLSTHDWADSRQALLRASLEWRHRPVLVGNPDVAAPRVDGFSLEPGHYAYDLAEQAGATPEFFGKPFANAFDEVKRRLRARGFDTPNWRRVAMVGDSLHTDILGGAAAGLRTVLVTDHGLFKGIDPQPYIDRSGIVPDFIVATT